MPKKAKAQDTQQKKREKVAVDKTFGLKNKNKSKKVQAYINNVNLAARGGGRGVKVVTEAEILSKRRKEKAEKERLANEMGALYKVVTSKQTTIPKGVDPKSIVCQFFKDGKCKKGRKCKFSHDAGVERKVNKMSLYADDKDDKDEKETMEDWSQDKLEDVINQKHTTRANETDIVCKFFIQAIEAKKYGWLWHCPNGDTCHYRHKLPKGFVLKSDKADEQEEEEQSIEEKIEEERSQLDRHRCTPVTLENFMKWKEEQKEKKRLESLKKVAASKKQAGSKKHGLHFGLSGRDLFDYDASLFVDDEGAGAAADYDITEEEEDKQEVARGAGATRRPEERKQPEASSPAVAAVAAAGAINEDLFLDDDDLEFPSSDEDDE